MRNLSRLLALVSVLALSSLAEARPTHFRGPHPIPGKHGHGYCYIEAPHIHDYAPDHQALYQQVDNEWVFTGDPTPFGYEGERHRWQGHHPIVVDGVSQPVYCVIDGPHVHEYAPPDEGPGFEVHDGVAVYVAPIPPVYVQPHRVRVVNAEYRPYFVASAPGVVVGAPGVAVEAPGVSVEVSAPGIVVGAPPPVVVAPPRAVFVAPGPPSVVVAPPRPVVVGAPGPVMVGAPGPVYVGGGRGRHEGWERHEEGGWGHHDNGRHNGWHK